MSVVAVTGGAQGIGLEIAMHFARSGYAVSFADTDDAAASEALAKIEATGTDVIFTKTDVSSVPEVEHFIERTRTLLDVPDFLVNNAGINRNMPLLDLTVEDFDRVIGVNLRGTFLCSKAAAKEMINRGNGGAIINIASTRAFMSEPDTEAYTASKGGIIALTHALAISLGPHRIRVNSISPGWIETRQAPVESERAHTQHPVGRVGRPEDVAQLCVFLAQSAGFITGQNFIVDGGMSVKMIYEE